MVYFIGITPRSRQSNWLKIIRKVNGVEYIWGFYCAYQ